MTTLNSLSNTHRPYKRRKLLGRGIGSGRGKTCGRGSKGMGSRSGYKERLGYEGGQFRVFMKLPVRGFSNVRFRKEYDTVNLSQINAMFSDGELVNLEALVSKGFIRTPKGCLKVLGNGELTKKVKIEAHTFSATAKRKLQEAGLSVKEVSSK